MKELVNTINRNFDLFDFLYQKYISFSIYDGRKVNPYHSEIKYDKEYVKQFRDNVNWNSISKSAPLTEDEIDLYFEELRKCHILVQYGPAVECLFSKNTNVKWNDSIIEKYQKHLHWPSICENPSVPWNEALIDNYLLNEYNTLSNWIAISSNTGIKWNEYLITKYKPLLYLNCIIKCSNIYWNKSLLNCALRLVPDEDKRLYLTYFSEIHNIEWDLDTLIDFPISYSYWAGNIINNRTINITFKDIRANIHRIKKDLFQILQLSEDLTWDSDLVTEFYEYIDFKALSASKNVNWSPELIELFNKEIDFENLSKNRNVLITSDLIHKYEDKWNFTSLSGNSNVKWNLKLIEKHISHVDLNKILEISDVFFSSEFIEKYKSRICWEGRWVKCGSDSDYYDASMISKLIKIPISVETLKSVTSKWETGCYLIRVGNDDEERDIGDWHYFSENMYLTEKHLENYKESLSWNILSRNQYLKISNDTLLKYSERWDYSEIMKRDDINWNVELFCKISQFLNCDILKVYENKIMEILKPAENIILNHFTYGNIDDLPLSSESWHTNYWDREYQGIYISYDENICSEAINEINATGTENIDEIWGWLRKYSPLYFEHSELSGRLEREAKSYLGQNREKIRKFIYEYQKVKKKFEVYWKERSH